MNIYRCICYNISLLQKMIQTVVLKVVVVRAVLNLSIYRCIYYNDSILQRMIQTVVLKVVVVRDV